MAAVGHDLWKHRAPLLAVAASPVLLVLLALLLLLADCLAKAVAEVAAELVVLVARAVLEAVALVAVVARVAAAHTQQVLAGLVALAGHWYWSFDHAAICRC